MIYSGTLNRAVEARGEGSIMAATLRLPGFPHTCAALRNRQQFSVQSTRIAASSKTNSDHYFWH